MEKNYKMFKEQYSIMQHTSWISAAIDYVNKLPNKDFSPEELKKHFDALDAIDNSIMDIISNWFPTSNFSSPGALKGYVGYFLHEWLLDNSFGSDVAVGDLFYCSVLGPELEPNKHAFYFDKTILKCMKIEDNKIHCLSKQGLDYIDTDENYLLYVIESK